DVLAEPLTLRDDTRRPVEVMLVDIAGLDMPRAALDRDAQEAARRAIRRADVILAIEDPSQATPPATLPAPPGVAVTRVRTKQATAPGRGALPGGHDVSAIPGHGLARLGFPITSEVQGRGVAPAAEMPPLQPRHEAALRGAAARLDAARSLLRPR